MGSAVVGRARWALAVVLLPAALLLTACGGDDDAPLTGDRDVRLLVTLSTRLLPWRR